MSQSYEFYDRQALAARADADGALLDNVRDRALRSEAAWRQLANRARQVENDRLVREQTKADAVRLAAAEEQSPWT